MDDFTTRTYGTSGLDNRPLFGETSARVGALTRPSALLQMPSHGLLPRCRCPHTAFCPAADALTRPPAPCRCPHWRTCARRTYECLFYKQDV